MSRELAMAIFACVIIFALFRDRGESMINGFEPDYDPDKWTFMTDYNNCYAYAFDNLKARHSKPQPNKQSGPNYRCDTMIEWIERDLVNRYDPKRKYSLIPGVFERKCPSGYHKIYLILSDDDYHFYRMDRDGFWSHKPGSSPVSRVDAEGKPIPNPAKANHNYRNNNYNRPCGFLCVPKIDEVF
jgi:hypothetical protein